MPRAVVSCVVATGIATAAAGAAAQSETPRAAIETLNQTLLSVMQEADTLGYDGRHQHLAPVLDQVFAFPQMIQVASGRYWAAFSADERAALVAAFTDMSVATYASRFDGYSGESFQIGGETEAPRGNGVLVETTLYRPSDDPVELTYLVREFSDGWRVLDVFLDGNFSQLAQQRSEYGSILNRDGHGGLLAELESLTARLEAR